MTRLIDADALPKGRVEWEDIVEAPTVDAVPVVRCRDCKRFYANDGTASQCRYSGNKEGHCFMAERKETK